MKDAQPPKIISRSRVSPISAARLTIEFERVFGEGIEFVKGCRTSFLFFLDNKYLRPLHAHVLISRSFNWTFVSPPANYCPTVGVGTYTAIPNDYLPVDENGDYRGIATSDLAIVLADEAEQ